MMVEWFFKNEVKIGLGIALLNFVGAALGFVAGNYVNAVIGLVLGVVMTWSALNVGVR